MREFIESVGVDKIKHNVLVKHKKEFEYMIGRTLTEKVYLWYYNIKEIPICGICKVEHIKFHNFQLGYKLTCSSKCTRQHPVFRENLSKAVKNSEKAKKQRHERSKLGAEAMKNKLDIDEKLKTEHYNKQKKSREVTFMEKYGVDNPMKIDEISSKNHKKMRETNIKNKRWLNYDDIGDDFKMYRKKVEYITSKQDISSLDNIDKRAHVSKENAHHLDHKYSIKQGFLDSIPVWIIGDICNLEMIEGKINLSKQAKCSVTKDWLLETFYLQNDPSYLVGDV